MKASQVWYTLAVSCLLVSQAQAQAQVWSVGDPPAGTTRSKVSNVLGKGQGWAGRTVKFKFGTTMPGNSGSGFLIILNGEREMDVTPVAMMPGMWQGKWEGDLNPPALGWKVSPLMSGMQGNMGMRTPDHTAGIVPKDSAGSEYLDAYTDQHTVFP